MNLLIYLSRRPTACNKRCILFTFCGVYSLTRKRDRWLVGLYCHLQRKAVDDHETLVIVIVV